jgi:hypothetical protein
MRTIREQLRGYMLDIARSVVYNAGNAESTHLWWPAALPYLPYISRKPHSHSAVFNVFWDRISGTLPLTQECVKLAQTGQRKQSNDCSMLTRLRKGILNSVVMRKVTCFKETTYGKNYGRL